MPFVISRRSSLVLNMFQNTRIKNLAFNENVISSRIEHSANSVSPAEFPVVVVKPASQLFEVHFCFQGLPRIGGIEFVLSVPNLSMT
jgi:hypothetical protein